MALPFDPATFDPEKFHYESHTYHLPSALEEAARRCGLAGKIEATRVSSAYTILYACALLPEETYWTMVRQVEQEVAQCWVPDPLA